MRLCQDESCLTLTLFSSMARHGGHDGRSFWMRMYFHPSRPFAT
jgi:hypothetical protein